jgi:hypothetical protein
MGRGGSGQGRRENGFVLRRKRDRHAAKFCRPHDEGGDSQRLEGYDRNPAAALTWQATKVEMADSGNLAYILAFDGTAICMFQTSSSVVEKFAADGTDLGIFASSGCNHPLGIMSDRNGSLYVANQGNATIERYSRNGTDMGAFATTRGGPHFLVLLKVDAR